MDDRRGVCRGGAVRLERAASAMRLLGEPLMSPTPLRPVQMKGALGRIRPQQSQQAPDLRDTVVYQVPFFVVAVMLRATTSAACASSASVICRYHAGHRRTS